MSELVRMKLKDTVRHESHPEWGLGIVVHTSPSLVIAEWQYHRQRIPMGHSLFEKVTSEQKEEASPNE